MISRLLLIVCSAVVLGACSREPDARLTRVNELIAENAGEALAALDSIAVDSLSEADRHYYDLLTVKARDKAYIAHTSDSLILDVINYYEGTDLYPEALYYGGRVFSDMGDYPTALDYFQRGLDEAGETTTSNMTIKGNMLSQMARLLNSLRLYTQAIPYIKEVLMLDSLERDTFNLAYDHQLLGAIYMHQDSLNLADNCFKKAVEWAQYLPDEDQAHMQMYEAACKLKQNKVDSALELIRGVPMRLSPSQQNVAFAYASEIYLKSNVLDSAYYYSDLLIHSTIPDNIRNGYYNLLLTDLSSQIPADSLMAYLKNYTNTLESYYDSHESQSAIMQNSLYNYKIQQRERVRAEKRVDLYLYITIILVIIILIFIIIILILRSRKLDLRLSLQSTIIKLDELREALDGNNTNYPVISMASASDLRFLRNQLAEKVEFLKNQPRKKTSVEDEILHSTGYEKIQEHILLGKNIPENSKIWSDIEQAILSCSPRFKEHLLLLSIAGQNLTPYQYHIVMLIRCGITSSQMAILLSKTRSTISYQRKQVGEAIFGQKIDIQYVDDVIFSI